MFMTYMTKAMDATSSIFDRELKKGSAELLILSLLEVRARHGYEISQLIELRSEGTLKFNVASFYPLLYRLEKRGWIEGRWVEKAGRRRRRYYRLKAAGEKNAQGAAADLGGVCRSDAEGDGSGAEGVALRASAHRSSPGGGGTRVGEE